MDNPQLAFFLPKIEEDRNNHFCKNDNSITMIRAEYCQTREGDDNAYPVLEKGISSVLAQHIENAQLFGAFIIIIIIIIIDHIIMYCPV